jgi:acyl-CoA thioesterase
MYAFDADTALEPLTAGVPGGLLAFGADIGHRWDTVGPPNGGYLLALVARGLARGVPFPDPLTITGHFLRPAMHTPVELFVEPMRAGKGHATAMARLHQNGKEILRALATFADLGDPVPAAGSGGPGERRGDGPRPPDLPAPEECMPAAELRPHQWTDVPGQVPAIYRAIDVRLLRPERREPGEVARVEGWMRFADGRDPDVAALPLLADAFPPTVLDCAESPWVPTVELTVHVRARPAPGWIAASFRTRFMSGGYFEEDGELWDSTGRLVAQSRQLAVTRPTRPAV